MSELISIITPVYNAGKYINETATSIIRQSYQNWEWIVIDDCSTDNSLELLNTFASTDQRIRILRNNVNSRTYASRNKGIENAKGKYIAFIDADDIWDANKIEIQLNLMVKNNYAFTYTNYKKFKSDVNLEGQIIKVPQEATFRDIMGNNYIATSSVMINKEITGDFKMQNVYHDDFTLWLDLLKRIPKAYGVNDILMMYRLTPNSLSRNKFKSALKVYNIFTNNLNLPYFKSRLYFVRWAFNTAKRYVFDNLF